MIQPFQSHVPSFVGLSWNKFLQEIGAEGLYLDHSKHSDNEPLVIYFPAYNTHASSSSLVTFYQRVYESFQHYSLCIYDDIVIKKNQKKSFSF